MKVNTECLNKFLEMILVNEEINLVEGVDYLVDEHGGIAWTGEYFYELARDAEIFEREFNQVTK